MIRAARTSDRDAIVDIHSAAARDGGGIAREPDEISPELVEAFLSKAMATGVALVACDGDRVIGEIHASRFVPRCFHHILAELTVVVHPADQGRGAGRALFTELLRVVREERPDFLNVELWVRASNRRGIALYESLGFRTAASVPGRVRVGTSFETDLLMVWSR